MTGAILNLVFILLMGNIYQKLAFKLTEWGYYQINLIWINSNI
jgi:hypothetical protein